MRSDQRSGKPDREDAVARTGRQPPPRATRGPTEPGDDAPRTEGSTRELRRPRELTERRRPARPPRSGRPTPPRTVRLPSLTGFVGGVVAAGFLGLALADGGFDSGVWAQATVLVWWTTLIALAAGAWPRVGLPAASALTGIALLGLAVLSGASMLWASDLGGAFTDAVRAVGYLGIFVLAAIASRAGVGRAVLAGVTVGLFAVALVALISRLQPGFGHGPDEARALEVSGGRLSFPLGYWNALGFCVAMAIPLLVWLGASARSRLWRAMAVAAIPTCWLTLFFTGSRGAAVAVAVALAVLVAAGPRRVTLVGVSVLGIGAGILLPSFAAVSPELLAGEQGSEAAAAGDRVLALTIVASLLAGLFAFGLDRRLAVAHLPVIGVRRAGLVLLGFVVTVAIAIDPAARLQAVDQGPTAPAPGESRFASAGGGSGRVQFWDTALAAASEEPLRGIGAGGFEPYWAQHGSLDFIVTHAHSLFLESAAELGALGGLFAIALFVFPTAAGIRRRVLPAAWADPEASGGVVGVALAVLAAGLVAAALDWVWDLPAAFVPAIIAAAFLVTPPAGSAPRTSRGRPGAARRIGVAAAVFTVGLASMAAAGALTVSENSLERSRESLAAGDPRGALEDVRMAMRTTPFASDAWAQRAAARQQLGNRAAAVRAIRRARERAELDWRLAFVEAGLEFERGRIGRGAWALSRAAELNPKAPADLFATPRSRPPGEAEARLARRLGGFGEERPGSGGG